MLKMYVTNKMWYLRLIRGMSNIWMLFVWHETSADIMLISNQNIGISKEWHDHFRWQLQHMLSIISIYDWQYILQSNNVHSGINYAIPTKLRPWHCWSYQHVLWALLISWFHNLKTSLRNKPFKFLKRKWLILSDEVRFLWFLLKTK